MLVTVAVVTFFGFLNEAENVDERSMRRAIAASVVMVYLVLLATVIFWVEIPGDPKTKLPDVTQTMLTHFTTIMGVVIAFYFGASAYIDKK
jgi:cytochrome bd-type quinol oxidase subunit 2